MIEVNVFGPTSVRTTTGELSGTGFGGRKPRELFAMLAVRPGVPRRRDDLAEELWDGRPPSSHVTTLQGYVSVLRAALSTIGAGSSVLTVDGCYLLDPRQVRVDLEMARAALVTDDRLAVLDAIDRGSLGLLPEDGCSGWAVRVRSDWEEAMCDAATNAAVAANAAGDHVVAVRLARAALAPTPGCEAAVRELMVGLVRLGRRAEALLAYHKLRRWLSEELGVEPQADTYGAFVDALRAGGGASGGEEVAVLLELLQERLRTGSPTAPDLRTAMDRVGRLLVVHARRGAWTRESHPAA